MRGKKNAAIGRNNFNKSKKEMSEVFREKENEPFKDEVTKNKVKEKMSKIKRQRGMCLKSLRTN